MNDARQDGASAGRSPQPTERGFTLIELMVVVSIIAILAGILIPNFVNARSQAMTAACESNLRSIATAAELFFADQQVYPSSGDVSVALFTANGTAYLNNVPVDPAATTPGAPYAFTNTTSGGTAGYTIVCPGTHMNSTLAKLQGYTAASSAIEYVAGTGLEAK
jgi:prepilin-type N-terminal cleavage/methylation domain-containing protein